MNKALSCIAAIILCISTLAAQDVAADGDGPRNNIGALTNFLELTEVQTGELLALQVTFIEGVKVIQQKIKEKKQGVQSELHSEFPDANLIGQLMIEIQDLNQQKKALKAEFNEPALAILTEEQVRRLGPLKRALRLARPAGQAVHFHLIIGGDRPDSDEAIL